METPAFGTWTPCSEALPPVGVPVIVKTSAGQSVAVRDEPRQPLQSWSLPTVIGDYDEEASLLDAHSSQPYGGVTHWMPCPPDPEPTAEESEEATAETAFQQHRKAAMSNLRAVALALNRDATIAQIGADVKAVGDRLRSLEWFGVPSAQAPADPA